MTGRLLILTVITTLCYVCSSTRHHRAADNPTNPLLVTPMINLSNWAESILDIQEACKVKTLPGDLLSYAGFITVNKTRITNNIFFWFFPSSYERDENPVIVWLFGGLGLTSMASVFFEIGPYEITENLSLKVRESSLTKNFSVIYIDTPVGSGFSFTSNDKGYSSSYEEVGSQLYSFLIQFFTVFPRYRSNELFLVGESFGGKIVTTTSYAIHKNNPSAEEYSKLNLKGLAIGNGILGVEDMNDYAYYLYQIGLIDIDGKEQFNGPEQQFYNLKRKNKYLEAFDIFDRTITGFYPNNRPTLIKNITGFSYINNYLYTGWDREISSFNVLSKFLTQPNIREAIHVGNAEFNLSSKEVIDHLRGDVVKSVQPFLEELLPNYRVLLFNGQLDLFVPYPVTEQLVKTLRWDKADQFFTAPRKHWYVGNDLAGYSSEGGNLNLVLVRDAGHYAPWEQPNWSLDMVTRFVRNKRFNESLS